MKALDRFLGLVALALGAGVTAFAVTETVSGRDPHGLLAILAGWVVGAVLAFALVAGYRIALQTQRDRLAALSAGFVVSAALGSQARRGIERLRPNLGFTIHSIAVLITDSGLQLWTGITSPFELVSVPWGAVTHWAANDSEIRVEIRNDRGEQFALVVSPRFVGRWVVRVPDSDRMDALRSELVKTPLGAIPYSTGELESFPRTQRWRL